MLKPLKPLTTCLLTLQPPSPRCRWDCHTPNLKLQVRPTPREDVVAVGPASEEHPSTTSSSTAPSSDTAIRSSTSVDQDSDGAGQGAGAGAGMGAGAAADTADADSGAATAAQVSTATPRQHRARRTPGELSEPNHQFDNTANTVTFHRQREQFWRELAQETPAPTLPLSANVGANVAARPANSPEQSMRRVSSALANGGQPAAFPSSQVAEPGSHVEAPELSLYAIGNRRPVDVRALVRGDSGLRALSKIVGSGCVGNDMVFGYAACERVLVAALTIPSPNDASVCLSSCLLAAWRLQCASPTHAPRAPLEVAAVLLRQSRTSTRGCEASTQARMTRL